MAAIFVSRVVLGIRFTHVGVLGLLAYPLHNKLFGWITPAQSRVADHQKVSGDNCL
jgi:hypothetical protein